MPVLVNNTLCHALFAALGLVLPGFVCAYDIGTEKEGKLRVLIDEGTIEQNAGDVDKSITSSSYTSVSVERYRDSLVQLPEILEQEVGVQIRSGGGTGSLATVVLRGASADQVMIYLDGVPINDASGSPVDLSLIPISSIERIDIYRGSTPVELGRPSIGGAINIITRQSMPGKQIAAGVSAGSFYTLKLSASSNYSEQRNEILTSASYLQSRNDFSFLNDNGTPFNTGDDRHEKRNNDGVKHLSVLTRWKHTVNKRLDTEVRLDLSDRSKEIPDIMNSPDVQTFVDTGKLDLLGQVNARSFVLKNIDVNVRLYAAIKDELFDDTLAQAGFVNQHTKSITRKAGTGFFFRLTQNNSIWKLKNDFSFENYDHTSNLALVSGQQSRRRQLDVSLENTRYFDESRLVANLVLRYQSVSDDIDETTDITGNTIAGAENTNHFINPQLGLRYRFRRNTYLTANIGQYSRVPSFLELFGGDGLLLGNPDLKAETSLNTDVGFVYTWYRPYHWLHDAELYTGFFYNRIQDLILRIFNGQGIGKSVNISDADISGFEATLKLSPAIHHSLHFSLSLLDSRIISDISSFNGKKLPGYYQQGFGMRYSWRHDHWMYRIEADIKRNLFYDRSNLLEGDDVNLLNIGLRYYFAHSNIDFRLDNLLDENIRYFRNRPTPGLNYSLSFNYLF